MTLKKENSLINKFEAVRSNINEDKELLENNINVYENIRKDINKENKDFSSCIDKYTSIEYYYCKNEGGFNVKY